MFGRKLRQNFRKKLVFISHFIVIYLHRLYSCELLKMMSGSKMKEKIFFYINYRTEIYIRISKKIKTNASTITIQQVLILH